MSILLVDKATLKVLKQIFIFIFKKTITKAKVIFKEIVKVFFNKS